MGPEHMLPRDDALAPLPAGQLHWLRCGELEVALAAAAGRRIAHLRYRGVEWLVDAGDRGGGDRLGLLPDGAVGRAHPPWTVPF